MIVDSKKELAPALERITRTLGISIDAEFLGAYVAGQIDGLFSDTRYTSLPTIQKYLISAKTFLLQPDISKWYDIRLASRTVPMMRILDQAIETVSRKVQNAESRFKDLLLQTTIDEFESRLYEIVVAARYAMTTKIRDVGFLDERPGEMSPDIRCIFRRRPLLIP